MGECVAGGRLDRMGEGEPAPAPEPTIRIFISGNSGSKEITVGQQRTIMILKSLGIKMDLVDISAPGIEEKRDLMRASAKKKEGQRFPLPPQIFHGEKYCGDYEDFDVANEDDDLEEFLNIPRKTPKAVKPGRERKRSLRRERKKQPLLRRRQIPSAMRLLRTRLQLRRKRRKLRRREL